MKASKISDGDIENLKVSSLPTRPTAPAAFGGKGYTSVEMKAAFDKLPLYIIERYNELIDCAEAVGDDSLAGIMKTGISETHTLADLFDDIKNGACADYMTVFESTLGEYLLNLRADINKIAEKLGMTLAK